MTLADVDGGVRLAVDGDLAGAVEQEALGDVVGVVVDEGLLDELVEIVEGDADRGCAAGRGSVRLAATSRQMRATSAVGVVEDVLLALGEETLVRALPTVSATSLSQNAPRHAGRAGLTSGTGDGRRRSTCRARRNGVFVRGVWTVRLRARSCAREGLLMGERGEGVDG
jgi:hypothetical protein